MRPIAFLTPHIAADAITTIPATAIKSERSIDVGTVRPAAEACEPITTAVIVTTAATLENKFFMENPLALFSAYMRGLSKNPIKAKNQNLTD
jgi:hypothetical protein